MTPCWPLTERFLKISAELLPLSDLLNWPRLFIILPKNFSNNGKAALFPIKGISKNKSQAFAIPSFVICLVFYNFLEGKTGVKIGYLGAGTWGFCLASLLGSKGHQVTLWTESPEFAKMLNKKREHPKLSRYKLDENVTVTSDLKEAINGAEMLAEAVTAMGIRPVFEQVLAFGGVDCPIVITSKGIEQNSCLLLPEVVLQVLGEGHREKIACLSGPSHAEEVIHNLPTSVVCASYEPALMVQVADAFTTPCFRDYPNAA